MEGWIRRLSTMPLRNPSWPNSLLVPTVAFRATKPELDRNPPCDDWSWVRTSSGTCCKQMWLGSWWRSWIDHSVNECDDAQFMNVPSTYQGRISPINGCSLLICRSEWSTPVYPTKDQVYNPREYCSIGFGCRLPDPHPYCFQIGWLLINSQHFYTTVTKTSHN